MFMEELEDDARLSANLVTYNSAISCFLVALCFLKRLRSWSTKGETTKVKENRQRERTYISIVLGCMLGLALTEHKNT